MSMKGFTKAVTRLPHQIASVTGYAESQADEEFDQLNERLNAFYFSLKKLFDDSKKFKDSLIMILDHQSMFFETLVIVLGSNSDTCSSETREMSQHLQKIASDIELNLKNVQNELRPELDIIETRVIIPCHEVIVLVENVRKLVVKRNHKKVDYDRFTGSQKKLMALERTANDERKLGKVEGSLDIATREYININGLLKQQIPILLTLKPQLVDPWFQTLYFYQIKVQLRLYQVFYQMVEANFDPHMTAKQVYESKAENCLRLLGELTVPRRRKPNNAPITDTNLPPAALGAPPPTYSSFGPRASNDKATHPSVSSQLEEKKDNSAMYNYNQMSGALDDSETSFSTVHLNAAPPTYLPERNKQRGTYVIALYDFAGEAEGDLSFCRDDKILVTIRSGSVNDWWTGELNGRTGVFPGNYVVDV